jgi:post-segregation antitoxin (ccd killing protein)
MEGAKTRTFRPNAQNQERLKIADNLGLNVSELINEALDKCAKKLIEDKTRKLREALSVPIP